MSENQTVVGKTLWGIVDNDDEQLHHTQGAAPAEETETRGCGLIPISMLGILHVSFQYDSQYVSYAIICGLPVINDDALSREVALLNLPRGKCRT